MKKAFSLITAIIFLVIIASVGALSLSLSNQSTKQAGDTYLSIQAEILAQSATELAMLSVSAHDINANKTCINKIEAWYPNKDKPLFDININISYLGKDLPEECTEKPGSKIKTDDSNVSIIIDTYVETHKGISSEPIRFHRRTLQKP